jgi:ADP-ribose pyrophosphatase
VTIVAVDDEDCVTLVRQFRAPARKALLELPAGKIDDGEDPAAAARRELEEEAGLRGGRWDEVTAFFTTPGFCNERMHVFFAEGLERGEHGERDADEEIELERWPVREVVRRIGELEDAKTIAALLLYASRRDIA